MKTFVGNEIAFWFMLFWLVFFSVLALLEYKIIRKLQDELQAERNNVKIVHEVPNHSVLKDH